MINTAEASRSNFYTVAIPFIIFRSSLRKCSSGYVLKKYITYSNHLLPPNPPTPLPPKKSYLSPDCKRQCLSGKVVLL